MVAVAVTRRARCEAHLLGPQTKPLRTAAARELAPSCQTCLKARKRMLVIPRAPKTSEARSARPFRHTHPALPASSHGPSSCKSPARARSPRCSLSPLSLEPGVALERRPPPSPRPSAPEHPQGERTERPTESLGVGRCSLDKFPS